MLNKNNVHELQTDRAVTMHRTDFRSTLPQHPGNEKQTNYVSEYNKSYQNGFNATVRERTAS